MYCKHCGKEITEDSTFCNHCGKSQGKERKSISTNTITIWIVYAMWFVSNFYLLQHKKDYEEYYTEIFYPFTNNDHYSGSHLFDPYFYDFSEFIVYVFVIPAILYIVYRRYTKQIDEFINKILNK